MQESTLEPINNLINFLIYKEITTIRFLQEYIEDDGQILTPLVVAARAGRERVVRMLLANYKMDLDKKCTVKFDGHFVHGASALWCASGMGKLMHSQPCTSWPEYYKHYDHLQEH